MSEERKKGTPGAIPPDSGALAEGVRAAAQDRQARERLQVWLLVEGGVKGERYELRFNASGTGVMECGLRNELAGVTYEPSVSRIGSKEFADLLSSIDVDRLVEASRVVPRIPPDSLVGRLRVTDGKQEVSVLFMADEEQAELAGHRPPRAVLELLDKIYELCGAQLGTERVRS